MQKRKDTIGQSARRDAGQRTTKVKTLFVEITAALDHVIDYWDAEHRRQVNDTVRKPIQPYKDRLNTV